MFKNDVAMALDASWYPPSPHNIFYEIKKLYYDEDNNNVTPIVIVSL